MEKKHIKVEKEIHSAYKKRAIDNDSTLEKEVNSVLKKELKESENKE